MKDTQKRFLGAVLAASSVVGVVAPSVTAMAAVSDEIKATPDELRAVINENLPKLKENPRFSTFHKIKFAADRLRDYNNLADEADKVMGEIAQYSEKVHTPEIIAIIDAMDKFGQEKNMASYDEILNKTLVELGNTDKDSADYLTQRLDSWGTDAVFQADPNYAKATDAIIKVTELRKAGKLDEAQTQADAAKKAIAEIKLEVNKPYLETLLKVETDAIETEIANQDLHVTSVVAKNSREIEVKFNKAVSQDSAENINNYEFKTANTDARTLEIRTNDGIELQDDNKTVMITLSDDSTKTLNNKTNAKYLVAVKNVLTDKDDEMKDYSEIVSLFDNVKPEVAGLEYRDADTLRVNFSEPVRIEGAASAVKVKLNGATVTLPADAIKNKDEDKMYIEISRSKAGLDVDKTYSLEIDGLTDFAGNSLTKYTSDILFNKDTVNPQVEKVEALSQYSFRVTFSEKITNEDTLTKLPFKVDTKSGRTASIVGIKHDKTGDDRDYKTFVVELAQGTAPSKMLDGNDLITISDFYDLAGNTQTASNKGDAKTLEVKFEDSHPALESTTPAYKTIYVDAAKTDAHKFAVYSFDRDVFVGTDDNVEVKHVDSDGVTKTQNVDLVDCNDYNVLESNEVAVDVTGLESGSYNFDLEKENVADDYGQNVEKINLQFGKGDKGIKFAVDKVYTKSDDNDKITVEFEKQLTKQGVLDAADASKYVIDGKAVATKAEVLEGKKKVELTLGEGAIDKNLDQRIVQISGIEGVKDFNEKVGVVGKTGKDATIKENKKAEIAKDKAEAISYNIIKLTMTEEIANNTSTNAFEVKVGVKSQKLDTISVDGNVITLTVVNNGENPFDTTSTITVKIKDEDGNGNNVQDLSENRTKEVTETVKPNFDLTLNKAITAVNDLKAGNRTDVTYVRDTIVNGTLPQGSTDRVNLNNQIDAFVNAGKVVTDLEVVSLTGTTEVTTVNAIKAAADSVQKVKELVQNGTSGLVRNELNKRILVREVAIATALDTEVGTNCIPEGKTAFTKAVTSANAVVASITVDKQDTTTTTLTDAINALTDAINAFVKTIK